MVANASLPLAVSATVPTLLGIMPLVLVLTMLVVPIFRRKYLSSQLVLPSFPNLAIPSNRTKPFNNDNGGNKTSKTSLNIRPLLLGDRAKMVRREDFGMPPRPSEENDVGFRAIFRGSAEPRKESQKVSGEGSENRSEAWVMPLVGMVIAGLITVISGVLYLSLHRSQSSSALNIAYATTVASLPIMAVTLASPPAVQSLSKIAPRSLIFIGVGITLGVSCLAAFVSLYIVLGISGACLIVLTFAICKRTEVICRMLGKNRIELLTDEPGSKAGRVNTREDDIEEMRPDSSWLTERIDNSNNTEPFSSFSYNTTVGSPSQGHVQRQRGESSRPTTPFIIGDADSDGLQTPRTPEMARTRSSSRVSDNRPESAMGRNSSERMRKSSWITEPSKTPTSFSSFSFGETSEPVPKLPLPYRSRTSEEAAGGRSFLNEGPSILKSSNPFDMNFTSLANGVGIRPLRGNTSTLSEETYHSAIDEGDMSFPRSVSLTFSDIGQDHNGQTRSYPTFVPGQSGEHEHLRDEGVEPRRGPSMESRRSRAPSPIGEPPALPLPACPVAKQVGRPRASSDATDYAQAGKIDRSSSRATISRPGSTIPQYVTMPLKTTEDGPLPSAAGRISPFSYNSILTPATTAFGSNGKYSTDPLLLPGQPSGRDTSNETRYNEIEELIQAADIANETSIMEERSKAELRLGALGIAGITVLWICWAFALPLAIKATRLSFCLYLVSLLMPAPLLLAGSILVGHLPEEVLSSRISSPKRSREKVTLSQEPKTGLDRIAEMSSRTIHPSGSHSRRRISIEAWARAFPSLSKIGYKNSSDPKRALNAGRDTRRNQAVNLERGRQQDIQMHRLSSDVWLENGHARRSSGKLDRIISMKMPRPQISIVSPGLEAEDPLATPKAFKLNPRSGLGIKMSPISFKAGPAYHDLPLEEPICALGPTIEVETPTKFDRSAYRNSAATSPGAKSVKTAEVRLATRTRMSQTPVFLFGGSQGDMIISPRPSMEAVGLVEEGKPEVGYVAEGVSCNATSNFESSSPGEAEELRRRTLELASDFLGNGEIVEAIEGTRRRTSKQIIPVTDDTQSSTPSGRHSYSITRQSLDLPPFRPSLDFVPPPLPGHASSASLDLGHASFDFASGLPLQHSTPHDKSGLQRRGSHKSNHSLPAISPKTGLLEDVKQALKQYGRSIDTPAKGPAVTKRNLIKRKASRETKSPLKGILKSRPSLDSLAVGLDLPPIPTQMRKAADKEAKAAHKIKKNSSANERISGRAVSTENPSTPVALPGSQAPNINGLHAPLATLAEGEEVSNRYCSSFEVPHSVGHETHQPEAMDRDVLDERGLPIDGFELSFDHDPEQLEEMEMVMTELDSMATDAFVSSTRDPSRSRTSSLHRPHSFAGSTSASTLQLPIPHQTREAEGKVSTETFMTMDSVDGMDPMHDSPSPALASHASRNTLILVSNRSREPSVPQPESSGPQAITSETISSGGRKAVRSSVHGQNNVSTFKRNSSQMTSGVPPRSGLKPLILAPVARGERETMLSDDALIPATTASAPLAASERLGVKQEHHGRGDSAFKFDDADDEEAIFTHSPRKVVRNPLQERKNVPSSGVKQDNAQEKPMKDFAATAPRVKSNDAKSIRGPPVSPKKLSRPSSRASSRGPGQRRSVRL